MNEYISREEFVSAIKARLNTSSAADFLCTIIVQAIKDFPAADVVPVRQGEWIFNPQSDDGYKHHMCPYCKTDAIFEYVYQDDYDETRDGDWTYIGQQEVGITERLTNYCPNCGARMKGVD